MGGAFSPRRFGRSEENCFGGRNWCVEAMDLADIKKVYLADVKKQEPDVELPSRAGARRRSSSGSSNGGRRMIRLLSVDTKKNE